VRSRSRWADLSALALSLVGPRLKWGLATKWSHCDLTDPLIQPDAIWTTSREGPGVRDEAEMAASRANPLSKDGRLDVSLELKRMRPHFERSNRVRETYK